MTYRGYDKETGLTKWKKTPEKHFVKFLQSSASWQIYDWFEIFCEKGHFKIQKNYKVPNWEVFAF